MGRERGSEAEGKLVEALGRQENCRGAVPEAEKGETEAEEVH